MIVFMVPFYKRKLIVIEYQQAKNTTDSKATTQIKTNFCLLKLPRLYAPSWDSLRAKIVFTFNSKLALDTYINLIFGAGVYLVREKETDDEGRTYEDQVYTGVGQLSELIACLSVSNTEDYLHSRYSSKNLINIECYEATTITAYIPNDTT